jgi:uncharacterized membrane protein
MQQVIRHYTHTTNIHPAERWLSALAGGALAIAGFRKRSVGGIALAAAGVGLMQRGLSGHCAAYESLGVRTAPRGQGRSISVPYELGLRIDQDIEIQRPPEEVYRFWRNLANLARFMRNIESVQETEGKRSHWKVKTASGQTMEWDAVIHNELANELIAWRSLPGADVDSAGSVWFKPTPGGHGTELRVEMQFNPPGGAIGAAVAKLWGDDPDRDMWEDLERLKHELETEPPARVA